MALHTFLGMDIGVPDPDALQEFFGEIGLIRSSTDGDVWGTADMPDQIRIVERPFRQLVTMRIGCDEAELDAAAARLDALGAPTIRDDDSLRCSHPGHGWQISLEAGPKIDLTAPPERAVNRPGDRRRSNERAEVVTETAHRPPRRLGHVVMGAPDTGAATQFFTDGIGMRVSDVVGGMATFMRCSSDHHNLLIQPAPVPYLNHDALEYDDIDAVGAAAAAYLRDRSDDHDIIGLGRHAIGANVFHYMKDPCGTMFECFSDMDDIPDDDAWEIRTDWGFDQLATWGANDPPTEFFAPADLSEIAAAFEAQEG